MADGEIKWIKLSTGIFDNDKIKQIEALPEGDSLIVIWLKLLVLAGEKNDGGAVYFTKTIPYSDQMLSVAFRRPLPTVQLALRVFEEFGMIEIINDFIMLPNWEKYQNVEGMDRVREQAKIRMRNCRERKRLAAAKQQTENDENGQCCVTVTQRYTDVTQQNKKEDIDIENISGMSTDIPCQSDARQKVISAWNDIGLTRIVKLGESTNRAKMLNARLKEYGLDAVLSAIEKVKQSPFLRGQNGNGWTATFDWMIKPNNFCKVLDGNYDERKGEANGQRMARAGGYCGPETGGSPGSGAGFSESQLREHRQREAEQRWGDLSHGNLP